MFSVRIHGRGGQGVVTAAEMLSVAAFDEGRHAQAFPSFGSERTGAPVVAFCRIDDRPIRFHDPVAAPDAVVVQDPTLLHLVPVFEGLVPDGYALVNTSRTWAELHLGDLGTADPLAAYDGKHLAVVPATEMSRDRLHRPMPNTPLLGALAALTGVVSLAAVQAAIRQRFGGEVGEVNADLAAAAHAHVLAGRHARA